jgi:serine/threonine-protein kinase
MAVAPDGSAIVYTAGPDRQQFYMRRLDSDSVTPIAGSEFGSRPFFSPDGRWIGFLGPDGLRKVPSSGGASQLITVVDGGFLGAVWLPDDTIVYCTRRAVLRIGSRGDQKPSVLKDAQVAGVYRSPSAMPDGKGVLLEYADSATPKIQLLTISTGNMHDVTDGGTPIALTGDELLFERSGTLFVAQFDPRHGGLLGAPISIAENVMVVPPVNLAQVAATSSLLVYARGATAPRTLVSVDRAGSALALLSVPGGAEDPRLSPDGKRVAMTVRSATDTDIWQADVQRRSMTRVTFERGEDEAPAWTSDGKRITYAGERAPNARATGNTAASGSPRDAIRGLYWKPFDGSGEEETLLTSSHPHTGAWSHDGKTLFYTDYSPAFAGELWTYSRDDRQKRVLLRTTFSTRAPAISPNGKWVAYTSSESGRDEIYVRPAGGPGGVVQVSVDGGEEALWSRSGDEIFFRDGTKMRSAMVRLTGGNFDTEPPKLLFDAPYVRARRGGEPGYDVGADGRFIMLRNEPDPDASRLHAQTGWFDDVDALLRTAGR